MTALPGDDPLASPPKTGSPHSFAVEATQYRSLPALGRAVQTRWAEPLSTVIDEVAAHPQDRNAEVNLAADISGWYGPFAVTWRSAGTSAESAVVIEGDVLDGEGTSVGGTRRRFAHEGDYLIVDNDLLFLDPAAQRRGFSTSLYGELNEYYQRSGVDVIRVHAALDVGGYAWARYGFDWDPNHVSASFGQLHQRISQLIASAGVTAHDKRILHTVREELDDLDPFGEWPAPVELADLNGDDPDLGRKLLLGVSWYGVYPLSEKGSRYGS